MPNDTLSKEERQAPLERRLATIMMADVAGYSRMMGENEERTVQTLRGHREIFDALLKLHRGRIFNTAGDAILGEFPSAVEAVRCATEIQAALRTRNEHLPEEQRMWFRIGINLGDVIIQGGDLLGDGVNVAARIQTIAEPGGVCISGSVYDQILNKLSLQFKLMGERSFKNIAQPIRTFSIAEADGTEMPTALEPERPKGKKVRGLIAALITLILVAGSGYWAFRNYEARRAEELRLAVEKERQAAEMERKTNEQQLAAEAAQRQAKVEAEALAAKAALDRAEADKKRLDQELKRSMAEKATENKAPAGSKATPQPAEPQRSASSPAASAPARELKGIERFDGAYDGRLCSDRRDPTPAKRCWPVTIKVERGAISGTWINPISEKTNYASGTISAEGAVSITLESWQPTGKPAVANLTGKIEGNAVSVSGAWKNGVPITGEWRRN
jgi:class 3 adenylate cyclase